MKVSIITATYNSARTLAQTMDSVFDQDYPNVEYIVIDGGSQDQSVQIIQAYEQRIAAWVSEKDNGIYDALNKGIKLATGDIVGFMHSDDVFASNDAISAIVHAFESSGAESVYADLLYVDQSNLNRVVRNWKSKPYHSGLFEIGWMPAHPTFYALKKVYDTYGLYNTQFKISADYELMLRMILKHGIRTNYLSKVIVKMRVGGESNVSWRNRFRANREDVQAWKINGLKLPPYTRWLKPLSKIAQFFK